MLCLGKQVGRDGRRETLGDDREGLVPVDLPPRRLGAPPRAHQRPLEPVGIVLELGERSPLRAEEAVREHVVGVATDQHELVALEVELEAAGGLAQRTGPERDAATHGPTVGHGNTVPFP